MRIFTHSGFMHADDMMAVAIVKKAFPTADIIRTTSLPGTIEKDAVILDMGLKCLPWDEKAQFAWLDHHQSNPPVRTTGEPYAACGLAWREFGKRFCKNDAVFAYVEENVMMPIDKADCDGPKAVVGAPDLTFSRFISFFNHINHPFIDAVEACTIMLNGAIVAAERSVANNMRLTEAIKRMDRDRLSVFEFHEKLTMTEQMIKDRPWLKAEIYPNPSPDRKGTFVCYLRNGTVTPDHWRGLEGEAAGAVASCPGLTFCHNNGTFMVGDTKEALEGAVKKILNPKKKRKGSEDLED